MICQFCNTEMEKGYLQAGQIMLWAKKKHKISLLPREGEVLVAKDYLFCVAPEAYICKECEKIVVDYTSTKAE